MLLAKAVIAYNMGTAENSRPLLLHRDNFLDFLRSAPRRNDDNAFDPTWFGYWLAIKDKSWELNQNGQIAGYLPYVTYLWVGAYYPATQADGTPHPKAGQPEWCFAYGEKEWWNPLLRADGQPATWRDYRNFALADEDLQIPCR